MAETTVRTELAIVIILCRVAGIAIGGCAPEDVIAMTARTGDIGVLPRQFESGQIVIEGGGCPAAG